MPAPDSVMVRIINPASRMPRPDPPYSSGDADAEPAVLRECGDEFLRKSTLAITLQPVIVAETAGYAGDRGDQTLQSIGARQGCLYSPRA
jgi:hypothetical protein